MLIEYFIVAGGGAGGGNVGTYGGSGGGGAGGLLQGSFTVTPGDWSVVVGAGGIYNPSGPSSNGGDSYIYGIVAATGGGAGGSVTPDIPSPGFSGGSGGGAGCGSPGSDGGGGGVGGQGYNGGTSYRFGNNAAGGGGGGIGGPGTGVQLNYQGSGYDVSGLGGDGIYSTFSGAQKSYAGGGAGGPGQFEGGGSGGGPPRTAPVTTGGNATGDHGVPNTGGGGAGGGGLYGGSGGGAWGWGPGGNGGSGIVMIRYGVPPAGITYATGGSIADVSGYRIHTFLASATFTVVAPTINSFLPPQIPQGVSTAVTIGGTNFAAPATLSFSHGGLTASNVVVVNANTLNAIVNVPPGAPIGTYWVKVTTPVGASAEGYFTVTASGSGMFMVMHV